MFRFRRKKKAPDPLAVVQRFVDAANRHDAQGVADCLHHDFDSMQPIYPSRNFRGADQVRRNWQAIFQSEPGFRLTLLRSAVADDTVWVELHGAGREVEVAGVFIMGVDNGVVRWARVYSAVVDQELAGPVDTGDQAAPAVAEQVDEAAMAAELRQMLDAGRQGATVGAGQAAAFVEPETAATDGDDTVLWSVPTGDDAVNGDAVPVAEAAAALDDGLATGDVPVTAPPDEWAPDAGDAESGAVAGGEPDAEPAGADVTVGEPAAGGVADGELAAGDVADAEPAVANVTVTEPVGVDVTDAEPAGADVTAFWGEPVEPADADVAAFWGEPVEGAPAAAQDDGEPVDPAPAAAFWDEPAVPASATGPVASDDAEPASPGWEQPASAPETHRMPTEAGLVDLLDSTAAPAAHSQPVVDLVTPPVDEPEPAAADEEPDAERAVLELKPERRFRRMPKPSRRS